MTVGGVGDVAWARPGAPRHGVGSGGVVRHAAPHAGAGGAVALALVGGAGLPGPGGGQRRVVLGQRVLAQAAAALIVIGSAEGQPLHYIMEIEGFKYVKS